MSDIQLYLSIGLPTLAVVIGIMVNGLLLSGLSARMSSLEARMLALENTTTTRFDLMMGKLSDLDNRMSVLEDRSKRS